jgi:hypothetical protein
MKKQIENFRKTHLSPLYRGIIILIFTSFIFVFETNNQSFAESANDFKVGDRVEVSVTGLEGDRYYEPCVITEIVHNGYRVKCNGWEYVVQKGWVRRPKGNAQPQAKNTDTPPQPDDDDDPPAKQPDEDDDDPPAKQPNDDDEDQLEDDNCNYNPPAGKVSNNDPFSETLAKRKIYDRYRMFANGMWQSPLQVGVSFLSFQLGKSFTNTAVNGNRKNSAAPVNASIYHVKAKIIVCEQYRNTTQRKQIESIYACFKNIDGEWVCAVDSFPKITQLK